MTPAQCRAGRALLDWNAEQLAEAAKVHRNTVGRFEGKKNVLHKHVQDMRAAMEAAGVTFTEDGKTVCVRIGE